MKNTQNPSLPMLLVDDELHALQSTQRMLLSAGFNNVLTCQDSRQVPDLFADNDLSVVMLDLTMPHVSGEQLLPSLVATYPEVPVIIQTGANEVETAVRCMKAGAFDYMVKPVEKSRLLAGIERAIELRDLRRENKLLRDHMLSGILKNPEAFSEIIANNAGMQTIFRYCESIAKTTRPVLLTGETGVGKELIARAIHVLSAREGAFVAVNAAGLDDTIFSDTLFGHARGAFTGADEARKGLIEQAAGGTLFLDEIGDLTPASQVKLLRVLQEHEYRPLGSDMAKRTDARILVATNHDLDALQTEAKFRKDLYHRLQTHHITIPPLRKRLDDLPLLLDHFLEKAATALEKKRPAPPKELYPLLASYHFPGNIRELEAMVFDAVAKHESRMLSMDEFKARIERSSATAAPSPQGASDVNSAFVFFEKLPTIKESVSGLIAEAMRRAEGNQTIAARLLGISRTALNKRLNQDEE